MDLQMEERITWFLLLFDAGLQQPADAIHQRDDDLVRKLGSFASGGPSVEDLATDGQVMWSSDEDTYRFYRYNNLQKIRDRFS